MNPTRSSTPSASASPPPSPAIGDAAWWRLAAALLGAGSLGVFLTCVCYVLAGPQAALPGGASSVESARLATAAGAGWMRAAGLIGMPGDLLLAVGSVMLAVLARHKALVCAGWLMLALASALFVLVDAMVGFLLPPLALAVVDTAGAAAYAAMRSLFDTLFLIGTWAMGVGLLACTWAAGLALRWVAWGLRVAGAVAVASSVLGLPGWVPPVLAGPSIALAVVMLMGVARALWRRGASRRD